MPIFDLVCREVFGRWKGGGGAMGAKRPYIFRITSIRLKKKPIKVIKKKRERKRIMNEMKNYF